MSCLQYRNNELYMENVSLKDIAQKYGTPCYLYSRATLQANWLAFDEAFKAVPHRICYAVKANSNIAILNLLAQLGSGFDIVSGGELERVLKAEGDPKKIIFSGVGKTATEIKRAIEVGIHCFNVESADELERLEMIANELKKTVNIAFRINPDVDPRTHSHIATGLRENKFGIALTEVIPLSRKIAAVPSLKLIGLACHIGSQITNLNPFVMALDRLLEIYQVLQKLGFHIEEINIGGGLAIVYNDEQPPAVREYAHVLEKKIAGLPVTIVIEPGRAIVGNTGVLLTRLEYIKHTDYKNFAIVDAGMNDLLRPALYNAWQAIKPVTVRNIDERIYDVVGPVCESSDFLGKDRSLAILPNDLLAIDTVGAYGFTMSSNYNSRCKAAEVLVDKSETYLIRRRETTNELFAAENMLEPVQS